MVLLLAFGCALMGAALSMFAVMKKDRGLPTSDEARFMLECVYEWGLKTTECRAMLDGANPPPNPDVECMDPRC